MRKNSARIHRELFEKYKRPIPPDHVLLSSCDEARCVNPAHHWPEKVQRAGQRHAAIDWDTVRAIRAAVGAGTPQGELAKTYAVDPSLISRVVSNEVWRDENYEPGVESVCARPGCSRRFKAIGTQRRFCKPACRSLDARRRHNGYYARREAAKRERTVNSVNRRALKGAMSLDAPLGDMPRAGTLGDVLADPRASDPMEVLERRLQQVLLFDVPDDIERLSDRDLERLQQTLLANGFAPATMSWAGEQMASL